MYKRQELTYAFNPLVYVSITGKYDNIESLGAHTRVYLNLELGNLVILPFLSLDHKRVGAIGMVGYFDVMGVLFSLGASYHPAILDAQVHNISLLIGTGFNGKLIKQ